MRRSEAYERTMRWRLANPTKWMLIGPRRRAKKAGFRFTLKPSDIRIPKRCPILGIKLVVGFGNGWTKDRMNWPSLDRIDNRKGYVPGNVAVISYRANQIKSNGTADEHRRIANWMDKKGGRK